MINIKTCLSDQRIDGDGLAFVGVVLRVNEFSEQFCTLPVRPLILFVSFCVT